MKSRVNLDPFLYPKKHSEENTKIAERWKELCNQLDPVFTSRGNMDGVKLIMRF